MKIQVYLSQGRKIKIIIPVLLFALVLRFLPGIAIKCIPAIKSDKLDIKQLNFKMLSKAFLSLRKYKGLILVEVKSCDGTTVIIKI